MRVSTDDSVSPSSTRGPREIEPNRREMPARRRGKEDGATTGVELEGNGESKAKRGNEVEGTDRAG